MLVPLIWQENYIKLDKPLKTITDRLSETGSHVETVNTYTTKMDGVVVGKVNKIEKHPHADKLFVLSIDIGKEKDTTIITAAKNVNQNDYVLVITSGTKLDNGVEIDDHDFFGINSEGMLLAYSEMNYPDSVIPKEFRDGVIILKEGFKPGTLASDALDSNSPVIEYEITPNRPDCLSILGMARETAASFESKVNYPKTDYECVDEELSKYANGVEVETEACKRYTARIIKDVKVEKSPQWLQNYLILAGMRPINNIVDITNFVMLETGQPIHAYDLDQLNDRKIIVRFAKDGEKLTTLDEGERELQNNDLVICDGKGIIGLAGIMGGLNSEVTNDTKDILLESANFDSDTIRQTSKRLGLRTEASTRFEKGINVESAELGSRRVMCLVNDLKCGTVLKDSYDVGKKKTEDIYVDMRISRLNLLIGRRFTKEEVKKYLEYLEFEVEDIDNDTLRAKVPSHRLDIEIEADLIEEVVRLFGMGKVKNKPLISSIRRGVRYPIRLLKDDLKNNLLGQKFFEITSYSFISPKEYDRLQIEKHSPLRNYVKILNPLGEDYSVMRTTIIPNMLEVARKNIKKKQKDLRLFEIGTIFEKSEHELPNEYQALTMAVFGDYDFYKLKDLFLKSMKKTGFTNFEFKANSKIKALHEGRCADIYLEGEKIGIMGEISYNTRKEYSIAGPLYILEINLSQILDKRNNEVKYTSIGKYPEISRDYSFVVDRNMECEEIEKVIRDKGEDLVKKIDLFDIYQGNQISSGKKSISYNISYRSDEKTLTDKEVAPIEENILNALKEKGVELRD